MKIADILPRNSVVPELAAESKQAVLEELAEVVCRAHPGIDHRRLVDVLVERESLGSTAIGGGIAIPHGKLPSIPGVLAAFGRSSQGVSFDSVDGEPSQIFFLLVAPEDSSGVHLKALARVSRLLRNDEFRQILLDTVDADALYEAIEREDSKF